MNAGDVMTPHVVTVLPNVDVKTVAKMMLCNGISAVPVIDDGDHLVGIISEGDLVRRAELKTEKRRSWWLNMLASDQAVAADYVKSHSHKVRDVMTTDVITVARDTSLNEIARLFEAHQIKRVPVVERGKIIGIVSRANLVQALANTIGLAPADENDARLRREVLHSLTGQPWSSRPISVQVRNGKVDLAGVVYSDAERDAIRVAAENTPGVASVANHLRVVLGPIGF